MNEFASSTQTLFNLSPTLFGQSQRVLNNVDNISGAGNVRLYNGLEWTVQGRFGRGGFFGGSVNYERTQEETCSVENRNSTIWCDSPHAWQTQFKASASYPIPKVDIVTSLLLQGYPGPDISANYTASPATILAQTGVSVTGVGSITYDLLPPDTYFLPFQTKVDLRFMRAFTMGANARFTPTARHLQPAQREHDDGDQQYLLLDRLDRMAGDHVGHAGPAGPDRGPARLVESAADLKVRTTTATTARDDRNTDERRPLLRPALFLVRSGRL